MPPLSLPSGLDVLDALHEFRLDRGLNPRICLASVAVQVEKRVEGRKDVHSVVAPLSQIIASKMHSVKDGRFGLRAFEDFYIYNEVCDQLATGGE